MANLSKKSSPESLWNLLERVLYFICITCLHMKFLLPRWPQLMQFVQFGLVGISNTLISYVVYLIGIACGMNYLPANILGFFVSILNSFYWNNKYVFAPGAGEHRSLIQSFVKTFLAYAGTGLVLNNILLVLQIHYLHVPQVIAPLINLVITIPLNFVLNKLWAFSKKQ